MNVDIQQHTNSDVLPNRLRTFPPAFEENNIPVFFSSSDYYMPYCAVSIQSLLEHTGDCNYDIIILSVDASEEKKNKLYKMAMGKANVSIRFLNIREEIAIYKDSLYVHSEFSIETFFRLFTPFIGENYEKILFLDSDIVIKEDVAKLYQSELGENFLGAVQDPVMVSFLNGGDEWMKQQLVTLNLTAPSLYFNAGIMLVNSKAMREKFTEKYILEFAAASKFHIFDQDTLNVLCEGRVAWLDYKWNTINLSDPKPRYLKSAPPDIMEKLMTAHGNPAIIHYTDKIKPWNEPHIDKAEDFWRVARTTPFFETLMFRLYEYIAIQKIQSLPRIYAIPPYSHLFRRALKRISVPLFPYDSKRREFIKKAWRCLRKK